MPSNTESTNPSFGEKVTFGSKREKFMVDIRRQSRQNILNRKRFMKKRDPNFNNYKNDPYDYLRLEPEGEKIVDLINETVNSSFDPTEINKYVQMIRSGNRLEKIVGIIKLRLVLSIPKNTPIQAVIDTNIASELLRIIKEKEEDYLRIEATWALTNLATGTNLQVQSLVDKGIIPVYVKILEENNINLIEQAVWGIGNLAGDCIQFRDELLQNNAMLQFSKLYERVKGSAKRTFINQLTWAASNLCRLKPVPEITMIASGIGMFCEGFKSGIIKASNDSNGEETQVIIDSIWAISQITSPFTIKAIAGYGILPYIMEILKSDQIIVVHPCLRIIGAYCSSSDDLCQEVISNDGISRVGSHLASTNPNIRKEACWILSNISAGTSEQIQELLNEKGVMEKLFSIASNDITSVSYPFLTLLGQKRSCLDYLQLDEEHVSAADGVPPQRRNLTDVLFDSHC